MTMKQIKLHLNYIYHSIVLYLVECRCPFRLSHFIDDFHNTVFMQLLLFCLFAFGFVINRYQSMCTFFVSKLETKDYCLSIVIILLHFLFITSIIELIATTNRVKIFQYLSISNLLEN